MWASRNLILLNLCDIFFILCIFVFVSLSLSNCHYYVPHYYEIIMHYFSSFTFIFGHPLFFPYYCPTTNKYSLSLSLSLSLSYNFIHNSLLTILVAAKKEKKEKKEKTMTKVLCHCLLIED